MTSSTHDAWQSAQAAAVAVPTTEAVLALVGPDALRFANAMFTQRFDDLELGRGRASAYCDAKGRLLGLLRAWRVGEERVVLVLEGTSADDFVARYGRYIVLDDVELEVLDVQHALVIGPSAGSDLGEALEPGGVIDAGDGVMVGRHLHAARPTCDVWGPAASVDDRLRALPTGSSELIDWLRAEDVRPRWPVDMGDKEMVHSLGLRDELLHFEKGCYIGQETIHRLDVMGKLRKRFARLVAEGPIGPGDEVRCDGRKVGQVTTAVYHASLGWVGMGIWRDPASEDGRVLSVLHEGAEVSARTLTRS